MVSLLIFVLLAITIFFVGNGLFVKLWYRWQLRKYTRRARRAKAIWLSTKESMKKGSGRSSDPWVIAEANFCDALVVMRTYEKLVSPMQPAPYDDPKDKSKSA